MMADVLALLMVRKIGVGEQIHIINHLRGDVNPSLPPNQSLALGSETSANTSYGNLRSADNFRGKHDATIA